MHIYSKVTWITQFFSSSLILFCLLSLFRNWFLCSLTINLGKRVSLIASWAKCGWWKKPNISPRDFSWDYYMFYRTSYLTTSQHFLSFVTFMLFAILEVLGKMQLNWPNLNNSAKLQKLNEKMIRIWFTGGNNHRCVLTKFLIPWWRRQVPNVLFPALSQLLCKIFVRCSGFCENINTFQIYCLRMFRKLYFLDRNEGWLVHRGNGIQGN